MSKKTKKQQGSLRLSEVISRVCSEQEDACGQLDAGRAAQIAFGMLDKSDVEELALEALAARISYHQTRAANNARASTGQLSFRGLGLRPAYIVDRVGRIIKRTEALTQIDFTRVITIRREGVEEDTAHLKILESAYRDVEPFWTQHPDMTFGEVHGMFSKYQKRA